MTTKKPRKPATASRLHTPPPPGAGADSGTGETSGEPGTVTANSAKVQALGPSDPWESTGAGNAAPAHPRPPAADARPDGPHPGAAAAAAVEAQAAAAPPRGNRPAVGTPAAGSAAARPAPARPAPAKRRFTRAKTAGSRPAVSNAAGSAAAGSAGPQPGASAAGGATVLSFPEPAHRRRRRVWLIGIASTAALVALVMGVVVFSPILAIRNIQVAGNDLAPTAEVLAALEPLNGRPLPQVGPDLVLGMLESLPAVGAVTLEADAPSTLIVHVQERHPVALLQNGATFALVDEAGTELLQVPDRSAAALPVIDGSRAPSDGPVFTAITGVLAALPEDVLAMLDHASAASIDSVELTLVDGKTVQWGNPADSALKAKVLEALLKAPAGETKVSVYDVSTPRQPVTR